MDWIERITGKFTKFTITINESCCVAGMKVARDQGRAGRNTSPEVKTYHNRIIYSTCGKYILVFLGNTKER